MITRQFINGKPLSPASKSDLDIAVLATFDNEDVQPNLTIEAPEFILEANAEIREWVKAGKIFEDIPFRIEAVDKNNTATAFEGFLKPYKENIFNDTEGYVACKIGTDLSLNTLFEQLEALDYAYLEAIGELNDGDFTTVEYTIEKIDYIIEQLIITAQLTALTITFIENIYKIQSAIATFSGIIAAGISGSVGAAIYAGLNIAFLVAYQALIAVQMYSLAQQTFRTFALPKREAKAMNLRKLLEIPLKYLGYKFETSIPEIDFYTVVPSNIRFDVFGLKGFIETPQGPDKGYPSIQDVGHNCLELFNAVKDRLFAARVAIIGDTVHLHRDNSPFWLKTANYQMPDVLDGDYRYNTDEIKAIYSIQFRGDTSDEYVLKEFKGRHYTNFTESQTLINNIEGREVVEIPFALASRKDSVSAFEKFLSTYFAAVDIIVNVFGAVAGIRSDFASRFRNKVGVMRVSSNQWSVAKLIYWNGSIPQNHRELVSARFLWENYHSSKSFVSNNYERQRKIYSGVEIPFGISDFEKVRKNAYFRTKEGKIAKIIKIEWNMNADEATVDYWVQEIYTKKLNEIAYEAE